MWVVTQNRVGNNKKFQRVHLDYASVQTFGGQI